MILKCLIALVYIVETTYKKLTRILVYLESNKIFYICYS